MKTYSRFLCLIFVLILFATFQGCGGGYNQFYRSTTPVKYRPTSNAQAYQFTPETYQHLLSSGYERIGEASFNGPYQGPDEAIYQANSVGADIVLIHVKYTDTRVGVVPIPQYHPPVIARDSGTVEITGSDGYSASGTYSGRTTYPGYTTYQYMPYSVQRYDHAAVFLRKKVEDQRPAPQTASVSATPQRYAPPASSSEGELKPENAFYVDGKPKIKIQVTSSLVREDGFTYEAWEHGAMMKNRIHPFLEQAGGEVRKALTIVYREMIHPTAYWQNAGTGEDTNISGVTFRRHLVGNFVERGLYNYAVGKGYRVDGQYSAVLFRRVINRDRLLVLGYLEKTPGEFVGMSSNPGSQSLEQKEYLRQLESRALEAFSVSTY